MVVGLFGIEFFNNYVEYYRQIINCLEKEKVGIAIYEPLYSLINGNVTFNTDVKTFSDYKDIKEKVDVLFSIGGDGTILKSVTLVRDSNIPILGINLGNLGFLSSISKDEIEKSISAVVKNDYILDKRTLIQLSTNQKLFGNLNFALNEFTVHKKDNLSMVTIHVYVDNQFLNSYWADGLIVSTPTGSTGYSLSCSGPIIVPDSNSFIINPISTHNLTVRPIVLSDNSIIKIKLNGRNDEFLCGLDSRFEVFDSSTELILSKSHFKINLIQIASHNFFNTIREKLNWGLDKRN
ncbi:MAG: NAD kinase [Bacteroidetes bacterium CG2_30_33_31]|nr:MAG: NAD kinase [Bacteroidetes bacterium CG2_30_33_31]